MNKILSTLMIAAVLSGCTPEEQTAAPAPQTLEAAASAPGAASLQPENIANYQEKYDVAQFLLAAQKTGLPQAQQKEREWNRKFAQAKNTQDVQAIFRDQLRYYREVETALVPLEMHSERGKTMHSQTLRGFSGVRALLEQLQHIDSDTPQGMVQANEVMEQLKAPMADLLQGMQLLKDMRADTGMELDEANEAQYREKMKRVEQFIKQ